VTSATDGGWSTNGYYVHNNMWNPTYGFGPETLYACSYRNWYVTSSQVNHAGAVLTYPNVHKDYNNDRISSFRRIDSTFAATSPHVGIYDVAYDIWINGVGSGTEIMIWTDNYKQVPSGDKVATVTFGGRTYAVWKTRDNGYVAFVPTRVVTSGSVDLLQMFKWLMARGWLPANSAVGQIDFGVEIVSTGGRPATFTFTDFSITDG
jgi:Glycosyl hydrolase family 12